MILIYLIIINLVNWFSDMNDLNFLFINHMIKEFSYEYFIGLIFIYRFNLEKSISKTNSIKVANFFVDTLLRNEGEEILFLDKNTLFSLRHFFSHKKSEYLLSDKRFSNLIYKANSNQFSLTREDIYYTYSYIINFSIFNDQSNCKIKDFFILEKNMGLAQKEIEVCLKNCFFRFISSKPFYDFTQKMNNYEKKQLKRFSLESFSYNKIVTFFKLERLSQKVG